MHLLIQHEQCIKKYIYHYIMCNSKVTNSSTATSYIITTGQIVFSLVEQNHIGVILLGNDPGRCYWLPTATWWWLLWQHVGHHED